MIGDARYSLFTWSNDYVTIVKSTLEVAPTSRRDPYFPEAFARTTGMPVEFVRIILDADWDDAWWWSRSGWW